MRRISPAVPSARIAFRPLRRLRRHLPLAGEGWGEAIRGTGRWCGMAEPEDPIHLSAEEARQGEEVMRKPWERIVFLVGLIAAIVLGALWLWR